MPTTNDKRLIKITANSAGVTASTFDVNLDASFDTPSDGAIKLSVTSSGGTDTSLHELVFSDAATGSEIGRTSISLVADTKIVGNFSATLAVDGRSETDPPASGSPAEIRSPTAQNRRNWTQDVNADSNGTVLRNSANVDVRSASDTASVSQLVRTSDDHTLMLAITFEPRGGAPTSGSVTLTTTATAGAGYNLGPVKTNVPGGR
ncbi:MAG: hypothetical protein H6710_17065 [Myxococcales bacterium]|nr:hypothetical protein [Myxococcales bacterium]MCB9704908.1 hypothetical protein [Myxococcales bacterium]